MTTAVAATPTEVLFLETVLIALCALVPIIIVLSLFENPERLHRRRRRREDRIVRSQITHHQREMKRLAKTTRKP